MLDRSFLDKIVEMSKANTFELGGYTYSDKNLTRIEEPPIYPLSFNTLQGICDVIKSEIDKYASPLVVIANYNSVTVYSTLKGNRDRDKIFISNAITPNTRFNDYIPLENFIISLKSDFCDSDDREKIIKMLSCVTDDSSVINSDDGISQKVEVIKGISLKDIKEIKERVSLTPYSCFNEVEQVPREFILRLKTINDKIHCALFAADGGMWKIKANVNVMNFINKELKDLEESGKVIITQ